MGKSNAGHHISLALLLSTPVKFSLTTNAGLVITQSPVLHQSFRLYT